jgi:hypothetical protein
VHQQRRPSQTNPEKGKRGRNKSWLSLARNVALYGTEENKMDGKGEKQGLQKNWRRKDSREHHTPMKNKVSWL